MSSGKVQNPPGFASCRVRKYETRRVSRHVVRRNPKLAGFRTLSCGKVQNPPGFSCTRVGRKSIRPETILAEGLGLKPAKFCMYPCRGVLHTPRNAPRRRFGCKTGRGLGVSGWGNMKPGAFLGASGCGNMKPAKSCTYPCRGVLHTPPNVPRRRFGPKTERVLGVSLLGRVKSGAFLGASGCGNMKPAKFCTYPCRGAKAYAPKCSSPKVWV